MLNKAICFKCFQDIRYKVGAGNGWFETEWKKVWEDGFTLCWGCDKSVYNKKRDIKKKPPKNCPYLLEHILEGQGAC